MTDITETLNTDSKKTVALLMDLRRILETILTEIRNASDRYETQPESPRPVQKPAGAKARR